MTDDRPTPGQLIAESIATMVLILFGVGGTVQVGTAADGAMGDHGDMAWAWGIGVIFAVYIGAKVSGAHLNPAVTIALAVFKRFPWGKVPGYIAAQLVGAFAGAAVVLVAYRDLLNSFDPGRTIAGQALFVTMPGNGIAPVSVASAFLDQVIGTAILLLGIFAVITAANDPPLSNLEPYVVGILVVGIDMAWGALAGAPINPARDLAPRLVLTFAGYDTAWSDQYGYPYWWVPVAAPIIGAILGGALFYFGIERFLPDAPGPEPAAAAAGATPPSPLTTQVASLATTFGIDFLTWDEDRPHERGAALARYFPSMSPEFLVGFGGWSGRGRQEAVEPLFAPTVTPRADGHSFDISQPVNVVTYRRGPGDRNWRLARFDTPSLRFTIHLAGDRLSIAPTLPTTTTVAGPVTAAATPPTPAASAVVGSSTHLPEPDAMATWLSSTAGGANGTPAHGAPFPDEPRSSMVVSYPESYAVRGTVRSAP